MNNRKKVIFILVFCITHIFLYIALFLFSKNKIYEYWHNSTQHIALIGLLLSAVLWACTTYQVNLIVKFTGRAIAMRFVHLQFIIWFVLFVIYSAVIYLLSSHLTIYDELKFVLTYFCDFCAYEITLSRLLKKRMMS